jgi:hypothetical protein
MFLVWAVRSISMRSQVALRAKPSKQWPTTPEPLVPLRRLRCEVFSLEFPPCYRHGSTTLNRGQAARSASSSHRGFLPRHLGSSAGGTG